MGETGCTEGMHRVGVGGWGGPHRWIPSLGGPQPAQSLRGERALAFMARPTAHERRASPAEVRRLLLGRGARGRGPGDRRCSRSYSRGGGGLAGKGGAKAQVCPVAGGQLERLLPGQLQVVLRRRRLGSQALLAWRAVRGRPQVRAAAVAVVVEGVEGDRHEPRAVPAAPAAPPHVARRRPRRPRPRHHAAAPAAPAADAATGTGGQLGRGGWVGRVG